ncbi:NACHT domain-containing protein [Nodosilinea sp. LEGE 07088]|uniref:NACHT domain-containing protein n=1 Tax=Nodosilinea sp. LEGE 07088 TaxID=2777968 RepID=UPI001882FC2A|nr:NACHT domain-containing protein [Nodosilinea sp. LEGE 07088]MBE9137025.1 NACHT domain-containing protein [Nodosilinea sp. LEGE 07088]
MISDSFGKNQKIDIEGSSIEGQVGQAGRDLRQFQFVFAKRKQKDLDQRDRQALLNKVKNFWIKGVLAQISDRPLVENRLEERLDVLEQAWGMVYETPQQLRQVLPAGIQITELFCQLGQGGTLLILGEPGCGKTRLLLELARDLINFAESDSEAPIPVVLCLDSWKGGRQSVANWLIQELQKRYRISKKLSKKLVEEEYLLLLLDGFSEVHPNQQETCVQALNQFIKRYGKTETIVCSRIQEYLNLSNRLQFQRAVCILARSAQI